jgi:hypothetical protein
MSGGPEGDGNGDRLMNAISHYDEEAFQYIPNNQNYVNEEGNTPLIVVADIPTKRLDRQNRILPRSPRTESKLEFIDRIVDALINAQANVDYKNRVGETPLSTAAEVGNNSIVEKLIAAGANIDTQDKIGYTPLMRAARAPTDRHKTVVKTLMAAGADQNIENVDGKTAAELAWFKDVEKIIDEGGLPGHKSAERKPGMRVMVLV